VESSHEEAIISAAVAAGIIASSSESDQIPLPGDWASGLQERVQLNVNVRRDLSRGVEEMFGDAIQRVADDISEAIDEGVSGEMNATDVVSNVVTGVLNTGESDFNFKNSIHEFRRIVSHEVASVADETGKTLAAMNPAVDLVRWELSGRHHLLSSSPDVCDILSIQNLYGYGSGLYHPSVVPSLPHPHCECRQRVVLKEETSEWFSGGSREVPDKPSFDESTIADLMDRSDAGNRSITDNHVSNQMGLMERVLGAVHENPRGL